MQIAIDGNEANISRRVGSNVYGFELLSALEKVSRSETDLSFKILLRDEPTADLPGERRGWRYQVIGPGLLWTQWALPLHLFIHRDQYDLLYTPSHYVPHHCPIPYVSSVMDTAYLEYPQFFRKKDLLQLKNWTERAVAKAAKVITISQASKAAIEKHYQRNKDDVLVAYPAYSAEPQVLDEEPAAEFFAKHDITQPYLLFVGTLQPRKNIANLVEAFEIFSRMIASRTLESKTNRRVTPDHKPAKLVLAGKIGWLADDMLERINKSPVKSRIIRTGFVSEAEKGSLYQSAFASILVGLYEGFGLPPLESLAHKTPTIVSNTSSLPEVVGQAGYQVDPTDPQEIAEAIWDAYTIKTTEKKEFRRQAKKQLEKFSWEDSAETVLETLQTAASE